jgi:DNA invertase Pin-like site-specific DNA recombinase
MPSANGHRRERAVLYARVSTEEQARSGYSLAQQLEALREHAAREGYEVLEGVEDPGQSGASLARPGLDRVRDLVAKGGVSIVLAQDRDRFAREPAYLYLLREVFAEKGTRLKALSDRGDDSPEGQLTDGILDQLAKFEPCQDRRKDKAGQAQEGTRRRGGRGAAGRLRLLLQRRTRWIHRARRGDASRTVHLPNDRGRFLGERHQDGAGGRKGSASQGSSLAAQLHTGVHLRRRLQAALLRGGGGPRLASGGVAPRP